MSDPLYSGAPGPGASAAEWTAYYNTPEGRVQLARDKAELKKKLQDAETRRRVKDILDKPR